MYHVILCDDDIKFLEYMKGKIVEAGLQSDEITFHEYTSGERLAEGIKKLECCDLLVLDMQLEGMDGDATAKIFREMFPSATLVFCTGVYQPTTKSFETQPYRYLMKSYSEDLILEEMKAVVAHVIEKQQEPTVIGKNGEMFVRLRLDDILFIEIRRRGSELHLHPSKLEKGKGKKLIAEKKVSELYNQLKNHGFEYAHNSYIVNLKYVDELKNGELKLADGTLLSISRSREKKFKSAFVGSISDRY